MPPRCSDGAGRRQLWERVAVAAALAGLVAWSCWQRWQLLTVSPFPVGIDGYFYPIELRALLDHGRLAYPAPPGAFYLLLPFAAATDPITGAKLGAAVWGAAIALPAYAVGARLARAECSPGGGRGAGLLAAAIATTSLGSLYLTIEFVKNSVGLTLALTALWLVLRAIERPAWPRLLAALAGVAAAWATHKMAAAIVAAVAVPAVIAAVLRATAAAAESRAGDAASSMTASRTAAGSAPAIVGSLTADPAHATAAPPTEIGAGGPAGGAAAAAVAVAARVARHRRSLVIACLAGLAAAALAVGAAFPHQLLSVSDAALFDGLFAAAPRWDAPALVRSGGVLTVGRDALIGSWLALAVLAVQLLGWLTHRRRADAAKSTASRPTPRTAAAAAAAWPILLLAVVIGSPWLAVTDPSGLGFRLRLAAFVPAALTAAIAARAVLGRVRYREPVLVALAVAIVAVAIVRPPDSPLDGEEITHPALVTAAQTLAGRVPAGATLIVPERHIAFLVGWYTGAPVALRPEAIPPARRYRLLPLHFIGAGSPLDHALMAARDQPSLPQPLGVHPLHPNGLVLVAEPTWEWLLAQLPTTDRARFAAWPAR